MGIYSDGLVYVFVDGNPVGTGLTIPNSYGDVVGYVDTDNIIILTGELSTGIYTVKYEIENENGTISTINIGELTLDMSDEPTTTSNILTSGKYEIALNMRWSASAVAYIDCNGMISITIPIADVLNKVIKFQGFTERHIASNIHPIWMVNNSDNTLVTKLAGVPTSSASPGCIWESSYLEVDDSGVYSLPVNNITFPSIASATYFVINLAASSSAITTLSDELVITIAESESSDIDKNKGNLADPTDSTWETDKRLATSYGYSKDNAGSILTNYIPAKQGDILRVKGLNLYGIVNSQHSAIACYSSTDTTSDSSGRLNAYQCYTYTSINASSSAEGVKDVVVKDGDIFTYTILLNGNGEQYSTSVGNTNYIRISAPLADGYTAEDIIITINEEITS